MGERRSEIVSERMSERWFEGMGEKMMKDVK